MSKQEKDFLSELIRSHRRTDTFQILDYLLRFLLLLNPHTYPSIT